MVAKNTEILRLYKAKNRDGFRGNMWLEDHGDTVSFCHRSGLR